MKRQAFLAGTAAAIAAGPFLRRSAFADASQTLKAAAAAKGIIYGSNVRDLGVLTQDPAFVELTTNQCALIEAGHTFQWYQLRPSPTSFNFSQADAFVDFARSHGLLVGECHLMWHHSTAKWLPGYLNASNWRDVLTNHVKTVVGRYAGRIYYWVVVNEAIQLKDGRPDGLRDTLWTSLGGQDAIDLAFRTAAAADPKAQLVYNDYGVEEDSAQAPEKRKVLLSMVQGMKSRGVPIHAVGIQAHLNGSKDFEGAGLGGFIDSLGALGVKVFVTELDAGDDTLPGDAGTRDQKMAQVYKAFLDTVLPHKNVTAIVNWSLSDKYFWRNDWQPNGRGHRSDGQPDRGVPFGSNLEPTPIYQTMLEAFNAAPKR